MEVKEVIENIISNCVEELSDDTIKYFLTTLKGYIKYSGENTIEYRVSTYLDTLCIHSINVAYISCLIGSQQVFCLNKEVKDALNSSEFSLEHLIECSLLHDIGKLFIDNRILSKKGKLTKEEREAIQCHSELGYKVLLRDSYFRGKYDILEGVLHHHERLDGTGYPHGITGETVQLFSRIISVADSYDAMTSYRIYNKIKNPIEAIKELESMDNQYDRQLVEILMGRFNTKLHEF